MKYDILYELKTYLESKYKKPTADKYYFAVSALFKDIQFNSGNEVPPGYILEKIRRLKTKHSISAATQGLKALQEINSSFVIPPQSEITDLRKNKRNVYKIKKRIIDIDKNNRKINGLQDNRKKIAYRVMQEAGLRVHEVSALQKRDIVVEGDTVTIHLRESKGDKGGYLKIRSPYLSKVFPEYLTDYEDTKKVFPSAQILKNTAVELGITCHNQRRIAAFNKYTQEKTNGREYALEATSDFLRHSQTKTTKIYLPNRRLKFATRQMKKKESNFTNE